MAFNHDRSVSPPHVGKHHSVIPASTGDQYNFLNNDTGVNLRLSAQETDTLYELWDVVGRSAGVDFETFLRSEFSKLAKGAK